MVLRREKREESREMMERTRARFVPRRAMEIDRKMGGIGIGLKNPVERTREGTEGGRKRIYLCLLTGLYIRE